MSFNTSNISCDTVYGTTSVSAPLHLVDGFPLTNNAGVLKLGDVDNASVSCLNLTVSAQLNAPLVVIDTVSTGELLPSGGVGSSILVDGFLNLQNNGLYNVNTLSVGYGATGSAGQVLSVGATGSLLWKNDAVADVSQWSTYTAVSDVTIPDANALNFGTQASLMSDGVGSLVTTAQVAAGYLYSTAGLGCAEDLYNLGNTCQLCRTDLTNLDVLLITKDANTIVSQTGASVSGLGTLACSKLLPTFKSANVYFVATNGNDSTGTGCVENPWASITHALSVCEALTTVDNLYRYIYVLAGVYTEDITIRKKVNLVGLGSSPFSSGVGCQLNGVIYVTIDANGTDIFNNACCISGLLLTGSLQFTSTANSVLNLDNMYIYSADLSGRALYFNPSCTNSRLRITNSQISTSGTTGTNPLIEVTKIGQVIMNNCICTAKNNQNVLTFSGTSTCDTINNCKFESDVVSSTAAAIVSITSTNSGTYTFTNCGFVYADTTSKAASPVSCGICCSAGSGNPRIVALYCSFFLLGTTSANYAIQDINYGTGTAMACLYYMNGGSLTNAFAIHAVLNTNKFQLNVVS